jgi:hypothetical protein
MTLRNDGIGWSGRRSEKHLAKKLGATPTPNSGAVAGAKGDLNLDAHLIEAKSTVAATLGLKHAWLSKIAKEARSVGKSPVLTLSFVTGDGRPKPSGEWVCLPLHEWKLLTGGE